MTAHKLRNEKATQKVLAVDDEYEVRKLYEIFLEFQGYEVISASGAEECMKVLKTNRPDIILLDVNMPNIDGLKLFEMIRASGEGKNIPIIMISARRDEETIKAAAQIGCDNFMIKPFDLKELAKRISAELTVIEFSFVLQSILKLGMQNNSYFHQPGLSGFSNLKWDCYPFLSDNLEFCIVVPRGLRPRGLLKGTEDEIKEKVKLFCKFPLKWRKVWP